MPEPLAPIAKAVVDTWSSPPGPANQDSVDGTGAWRHQLWPGQGVTASYPWATATPDVYQIKLQVAGHDFTSSLVQPIDSSGKDVVPPGSSNTNPRTLPSSTIYGFNGTFPGPRINARYGRAALVRFENHLGEDNGYDRQDFGSPNYSFITDLHNGHTASESDGIPSGSARSGARRTRRPTSPASGWTTSISATRPAATTEKQSFFWFHDHVYGHTGANVYKGMVGLMPLYDPKIDSADESDPDGYLKVDYDIPLAFFDCRLDDGVTPHKDAHNGNGETHPEWWGKSYFRHFPNHGFVGDIFTVNGKASSTARSRASTASR